MRHAPSTLDVRHRFAPPLAAGGIEWEELPSLASRVRALGSLAAAAGSAWDATRPAELEPRAVPTPFREPVAGVSVREVIEPDVFRHFFGP